MRVKHNHKAILDYMDRHGVVSTTGLARVFDCPPAKMGDLLHRFAHKGLITKLAPQSGSRSATWQRTNLSLQEWLTQFNHLTVEITIKPDLAAMWLVESKPQWAKRSIPIVRSIELGARLDMSLK